MKMQQPTFKQVMRKTSIDYQSLKNLPLNKLAVPMYTPTTFQITNPSIPNVKRVKMIEAFQACFVHTKPIRLPPTHTNTVNTYNSAVIFAIYGMNGRLADCLTVVKSVKKKKAGVKYPLMNDILAMSIDSGNMKQLLQQLWLLSITLKQQLRQTYQNAKQLLLIHLLRCFINQIRQICTSQSVFIGSVRAMALGIYFKMQFLSCWQQIPRLKIRSQARYMLAYLQSRYQMLGSNIILKYFLQRRFCQNFQPWIKAQYRQADQAPGSTWRKPVALQAFLSMKWAMIYSNYWAFQTEQKQFLKMLVVKPSDSPSSDMKLLSTDIRPVAPPTFSSANALIKLTIPFLSGSVPTSNNTQYDGLMCRQKPSKNQR